LDFILGQMSVEYNPLRGISIQKQLSPRVSITPPHPPIPLLKREMKREHGQFIVTYGRHNMK
jgi:hypothetical protein